MTPDPGSTAAHGTAQRWRIVAASTARRDLGALPSRAAAALIEFVNGPLAENPHRLGAELRDELAGLRSARRGEYRVVYRIDEPDHTVEIVHLGHRRSVYRPRR